MNIQDLGSTGEFIAAIATLVTLVYLASQIRQSTKVAKAQLTKDLFLASRTALMDIAKHPHLAGLAVTHLGVDTPEYQGDFVKHINDILDENEKLA